jgi:hypothetical protein
MLLSVRLKSVRTSNTALTLDLGAPSQKGHLFFVDVAVVEYDFYTILTIFVIILEPCHSTYIVKTVLL